MYSLEKESLALEAINIASKTINKNHAAYEEYQEALERMETSSYYAAACSARISIEHSIGACTNEWYEVDRIVKVLLQS